MFSAAYALAVPSVCPHLKVDEDAAKERAEEGKNAWAKSIPDHNASHLDADSILRFQEKGQGGGVNEKKSPKVVLTQTPQTQVRL